MYDLQSQSWLESIETYSENLLSKYYNVYQLSSFCYDLGCIRLSNFSSVKLRSDWLLAVLDKLPRSSTLSKVEAKMVSTGGYIVKLSQRELYFSTITGKTSLCSSGQLGLNFAYYTRIHIVVNFGVFGIVQLLTTLNALRENILIPHISLMIQTNQYSRNIYTLCLLLK